MYSAIALDMNIWGFGESVSGAKAELVGNIKALISFAFQYNCISIIESAASDAYLERYYSCLYSRLPQYQAKNKAISMQYPEIFHDAFTNCTDHPWNMSLRKIDTKLRLYKHTGDAHSMILYYIDFNQRQTAYPLTVNPDKKLVHPDHLPKIADRFAIPLDELTFLTEELE